MFRSYIRENIFWTQKHIVNTHLHIRNTNFDRSPAQCFLILSQKPSNSLSKIANQTDPQLSKILTEILNLPYTATIFVNNIRVNYPPTEYATTFMDTK